MPALNEGEIVSCVVRISNVARKKDKNQKDFYSLTIDDGKEKTQAYLWDTSIFDLKSGQTLWMKCKFGRFGEKQKFDIIDVRETKEKLKLPGITDDERIRYTARFNELLDMIKDPDYRVAMDCIFADPDLWEMFSWAPAATGNHEAYQGGLLKHTTEVVERCIDEYNRNPLNLNLSLLISGAMMHDFGKVVEYQWEDCFDRTTPGKLVGHIQIANIMLGRKLPDDFPKDKAMLIYHLIISHQGQKDWGSPIEPRTKEALVLHYADMMRSYTAHFDEICEKSGDKEWSDYDNTFKRPWYLHSNK